MSSERSHTKSSGESACSPPTWMKLPSLPKCMCRCCGMADLAILLGVWEPIRNSLFRSNNFTWRPTASFLCRKRGDSGLPKWVNVCVWEDIWLWPTHQFFIQMNSTDFKVKHEQLCYSSTRGSKKMQSSCRIWNITCLFFHFKLI